MRYLDEIDSYRTPVIGVENSAATVCMDANDICTNLFNQAFQVIDLEHRNAKF